MPLTRNGGAKVVFFSGLWRVIAFFLRLIHVFSTLGPVFAVFCSPFWCVSDAFRFLLALFRILFVGVIRDE